MRIGVDIDDTICRSTDYFIYEFNKKHKVKIRKEDITENTFKISNDFNEEYIKREQDLHLHNSLQFYDIVENSKEVLEVLKEKAELIVITSRRIALREKTLEWINHHFGNNFFDKVVFYNVKREDIPKSQICIREEIDILIEDNPYHAYESSKNGIDVFLIDQPWNKSLAESNKIKKVRDWREIHQNLIKI